MGSLLRMNTQLLCLPAELNLCLNFLDFVAVQSISNTSNWKIPKSQNWLLTYRSLLHGRHDSWGDSRITAQESAQVLDDLGTGVGGAHKAALHDTGQTPSCLSSHLWVLLLLHGLHHGPDDRVQLLWQWLQADHGQGQAAQHPATIKDPLNVI